jgi:hypothetical protein
MLRGIGIRTRVRSILRSYEYQRVKSPDHYRVGSADWLVAAEKHFGGYVSRVLRNRISDLDPRSSEQIATGGMIGGDRMFHHQYASAYEKYLSPFIETHSARLVIVEVGILRGSGLAIWSVLFPNADIIGLDIDLNHIGENLGKLIERGAFQRKLPELHTFDQFKDGAERMAEILCGRKVDICMDDGLHLVETIKNTACAMRPHLSKRFVYFAEDNTKVAPVLKDVFPNCDVTPHGPLTVIDSNYGSPS